jgi:hypothetical protein
MKRLLEFSHMYKFPIESECLELKEKPLTPPAEDFKEFKTNYENLFIAFLKESICKNKDEIVLEYLNFIFKFKDDLPKNLYICYKLLKFFFLCEQKSNYNRYKKCLDDIIAILIRTSQLIEFNENLINMIQTLSALRTSNIKADKILKTIDMFKAICIRLIDDYYLKNDKSEMFDGQEQLNKDYFKYSSTNIIQLHSKTIKKSKPKKDLSKHNVLESICNNLTPTMMVMRSVYLCIFAPLSPLESYRFIKKPGVIKTVYVWKHALSAMINFIVKVSSYQYTHSSEVLQFSYHYVTSIFYDIIERYKKNPKSEKNTFQEIIDSKKLGLDFFYSCLTSSVVGDENCILFKEQIKKNLIEIINQTIDEADDPFYFDLIYKLYCNNKEIPIIISLLEILIQNLTLKVKDSLERCNASNTKNLVMLICRMINVKAVGKEIFHEPKMEDLICQFLLYFSGNQIIYTKVSFNLASGAYSYKSADVGSRTSKSIKNIKII